MKLLEKKRDELADAHTSSTYFHLEYSISGNTARECNNSFKCGFDAAIKELEPVLKELYEALRYYEEGNVLYIDGTINRDVASDALDEYRKIIRGEK